MNRIDEYIDNVCKQIRNKKAHKLIKNELENHIIDQKNAFIKQGLDEQTALDNAIKEMGDPISVGNQFDKIHRTKPEWSIIFFTAVMIIINLAVNILISKDRNLIDSAVLCKLFISAALGIALLSVLYFIDYSIIVKYSKILLIAFVVIGFILNTNYYISKIFSRIIILAIPLYATIVYNLKGKGYTGIIISVLGCLGMTAVFLDSFVSYALIFALCCIIILNVSILKGWFNIKNKSFTVLCGFIILFVPIVFILINSPYRLKRLVFIINPYKDPLGAGYQSVITKEVLKHSQFIGAFEPFDFFNNTINPQNITGFVPEFEDLIITYLISKFGFIAGIFVIGMFAILIARIFKICFNQKSYLGFIVSFSCILAITIQTINYITFNLGFYLLSSGLPLITSGVSLIVNMCLIGILLSVFKNDNLINC